MYLGTKAGWTHTDGHVPVGSAPIDQQPVTQEAMFLFRVANYRYILAAFGDRVAKQAVAAASERLSGMLGLDGSVRTCRHDVLGVRLKSGPTLGDNFDTERCHAWMRLVCETVPLVPFECGPDKVHLWLSGYWTLGGDPDGFSTPEWQFPYAIPDQRQPNWAQQYRKDMANASRVLIGVGVPGGDTDSGGVMRPFWQKVHSVSLGTTQFFEAFARIPDDRGNSVSIASNVLSLERTGFVRLLDLHMVRQVIAELDRSSEIQAAVNLSALSLRADPWWDDVKATLAKRRDIAERLFLEITETAAFASVSDAVRFVDGMRKLGCRIVLDDFGTGHASIRQLFALSPEIVKIDRLFLRRATLSDRDREIFLRLAQLAGSTGATVVAEGVETRQQKQIALEAGVDWQQGYLWGHATGGHPRSCNIAASEAHSMSAAL